MSTSSDKNRKPVQGIEPRHSRGCPAKGWERCSCSPAFRAEVYSKREAKKIRKTFPTLSAAKSWRIDMLGAKRRGTLRAPTKKTLRQAADELIVGMNAGSIRNRSGRPYKPSVRRDYERLLNSVVVLFFGEMTRLEDIRRPEIKKFVGQMQADGLDPSTIRNSLMPLRVIFREALDNDEIDVNPCAGLKLPAVTGRRECVGSTELIEKYIAAVPEEYRALWATAFYGGPRMGELQALQVEAVDLAAGRIQIEQSWDKREGFIPTKGLERRTTPVPAVLRDYLDEHLLRTKRERGFVFGESEDRPFNYDKMHRRSQKAFEEARLPPITLHQARHTFVTVMFEAGLSLERIGDYVGHSSTYMTERYRHLLEGHEAEAAAQLDAYLERADSAARLAQIALGGAS